MNVRNPRDKLIRLITFLGGIYFVLPDFDSYPQHSNQITPQVTDFTKHDFSLR
jgi:hypothetical protein